MGLIFYVDRGKWMGYQWYIYIYDPWIFGEFPFGIIKDRSLGNPRTNRGLFQQAMELISRG